MDFFQAQERARRNTRLAVFLFALAVTAIVLAVVVLYILFASSIWIYPSIGHIANAEWWAAHGGNVIFVGVSTLGLILLGSIVEFANLTKGGGAVAQALGGVRLLPDSKNLDERKLYNIVQEMAIASGITVPEVYLLPNEAGINAFAAGLTPANAAIGVTRGAIEKLSRDELQGVIAHEFSHILNGDMRLNLRLMGWLHGILLVALMGRTLMRSFSLRAYNSRRGNAGGPVILLGAALYALGYIGVFFARLIQALISRQREFLADASAVQFTRNPDGIAGALKTIAGYKPGSKLRAAQAEAISHMLFGAQHGARWGLFASHPPIEARIRAIDPSFDAAASSSTARPKRAAVGTAAFADQAAVAASAAGLVERAGRLDATTLVVAERLLASLPVSVTTALQHSDGAELLVLALVLQDIPQERQAQLPVLREAFSVERIQQIVALVQELRPLGPGVRLPLIELALPVLRQAGADRVHHLVQLVRHLALSNNELSPFELVLISLLQAELRDAFEPRLRQQHRVDLYKRRADIQKLFSVLAQLGARDAAAAQKAYAAGMHQLWGATWSETDLLPVPLLQLELALKGLDDLAYNAKRQLVAALTTVVAHDDQIQLEEYEVLRAVCAMIHCPLPPLVVGQSSKQRS